MIFDHRTYTVKAGTIKKQLELYEEHGWAVQTRHLGHPIVYAGTEVGNVNSYVHIWAYADVTDRARKRASMQADPGWQKYLQISAEAGCLIAQENQILVSVPFYTPPAEFKALDDA
ncbi:MAG TPA: NIPSNAP family protein [Gammaproteobacteria bacterium]|nr:MAG: NIPSNAP family protein [Acidithiobacillus sp.]HAD36222.1 NIPSNAP family protein [Gammaproteobacteria bacterium]HBK76293.1 NIPSNAP family protein [Gammaproteobacteria bacterium]HIM86977.1 NIPSNAP family protein [Gammaproteobacteria bacterium]HIM97730.1 NIPSNAP family protein [Gammaproteobacteria bacterium]